MKKLLRWIGRAKYKLIRVVAYIQILNLILLIQVAGFQWWMLLVPPIFLVLYLFEVKHGIPGEQDVGWGNSSEWQNFKVSNALHQAYVKYTFAEIKDELIRLQNKKPRKKDKETYRETILTVDDLKRRGKRGENE